MTMVDVDVLSRVKELLRYHILDTLRDEPFDRITALAANVFGTPVAFISFVDESRQWLKSNVGWDVVETPKKESFCVHAIQDVKVLVVEDLSRDPRFNDNPFVVGPPAARFYAGAPLITPSGVRIGALAVMDWKPRAFTSAQRAALQMMADMVVQEIENHLNRIRYEDAISFNEVAAFISNEAIVTLDENFRVRSFNPLAEEIFQVGKRDIIGQKVETLFPARLRQAQAHAIKSVAEGLALRETLSPRGGAYAMRADGSEFPILATVGKVNMQDRVVMILMIRDISAQVLLENELKLALESSTIANDAKERYLAAIGHEFRTPLNAIVGFAELMAGEMLGPLGSHRYREYATSIAESGWRLTSVLRDVLELQKLQDRLLEVKLAPFDMMPRLRAIIEKERQMAQSKGVRIMIQDRNIGPRKIMTDGLVVETILSHLISNAIHFSHEHGLIKIEVEFIPAERMVAVRVVDHGLGVEPGDLSRLGEPFFRGVAAIQNNIPGAGLGLAISQRMAAAMGGAVEVDGNPGLGATALLTFPSVFED